MKKKENKKVRKQKKEWKICTSLAGNQSWGERAPLESLPTGFLSVITKEKRAQIPGKRLIAADDLMREGILQKKTDA